MKIYMEKFTTGACSGGAGVSTATGYSGEIEGEILSISVKYQGSPPATTDLVISDARDDAAAAILSLSNYATDGRWYPRRSVCDSTGVPYKDVVRIPIASRIKAVISQANDADYADITVWYTR